MDRPKSYSSSIKSNSSNRSSGLFRSVMGMFQSVVSNENDTNNDKDIPYQGIFKHLDSGIIFILFYFILFFTLIYIYKVL